MDELHKAAKRLLEDGMGAIDRPLWVAKAVMALARNYLAHNQADDEATVTKEWLRTAGFRDNGTSCLSFASTAAGPVFELCADLDVGCDGWGIRQLISGKVYFVDINQQETRGDVRRLCRQLRIPLGEVAWRTEG